MRVNEPSGFWKTSAVAEEALAIRLLRTGSKLWSPLAGPVVTGWLVAWCGRKASS